MYISYLLNVDDLAVLGASHQQCHSCLGVLVGWVQYVGECWYVVFFYHFYYEYINFYCYHCIMIFFGASDVFCKLEFRTVL